MDRRDIPKLELSNYGPWLIALRSAAYTYDAIYHFEGNPPTPDNEQDLHTHTLAKHTLIGKIITTIPADILNLLLMPDEQPTQYDILQKLTIQLDTTNASDHICLKQLAEQCQIEEGQTVYEYVKRHETIRAQMIAARFPDIAKTSTTVDFMIDGLKKNPSTAYIGLQLLSLQPKSIKDFVHKYNRIENYRLAMQPSNPWQTATPAHHAYNRTSRQRVPRHFTRHSSTYHPNACRQHIFKGVRRPQHCDTECRDPTHPQHQKASRKKSFPKARVIQEPSFQTQPDQEADDNESDDNETYAADGMFIVDSAAHPTHTSQPNAQHHRRHHTRTPAHLRSPPIPRRPTMGGRIQRRARHPRQTTYYQMDPRDKSAAR